MKMSGQIKYRNNFVFFKGTVCVTLDDPPCKDGNFRFTSVPLKP